jgi:hypothetical protein
LIRGPLLFLVAATLLGAAVLAVLKTFDAPKPEERVARAEALVARLRDACARFHADVGRRPKEYVLHPPSARELSAPQTIPGWKGPYLSPPLVFTDAAISARVYVLAESKSPPNADGFDTDGDGAFEAPRDASVVRFEYAEEGWSRDLDRRLDAGVPGDWFKTGRVRFFGEKAGKPGTTDVLLAP